MIRNPTPEVKTTTRGVAPVDQQGPGPLRPGASDVFTLSIRFMPGVGPKRAEVFKRLGLATVADLLYHIPRRYEDRSRFVPIAQATPDLPQTIHGVVAATGVFRSKRGTLVFQLTLKDDTGAAQALWFNQPYLRTWFTLGQELILYGRPQRIGRKLQFHVPEFEVVTHDELDSLHMGRIVPIYPATSGLHQRAIRALVKQAVDRYAAAMPDPLPPAICQRAGVGPLAQALADIHFPPSDEARRRAEERLGFDELFLFQVAVAQKRHRFKTATGLAHQTDGPLVQGLRAALPFPLTASQQNTITEIFEDLGQPRPMHRLLHGDVGSGKTVVATLAACAAIQSGYQVAFMAPTEILAEQHAATLRALLAPVGIAPALLVGRLSDDERRPTVAGLARGTVPLVIGTHALLQESVAFHRLGLIIIDEQHKFGVTQRAALRAKGASPDVLVMTATPIPRTLALTLYGDLDVSAITELPPGRRPVATARVGTDRRAATYRLLAQAMDQGRQCYVVCPRIGKGTVPERGLSLFPADLFEPPADDLKAATKIFEYFRDQVFPRYRVGLLHGRLLDDEKERVMRAFVNGQIQLLVATQVIEVGIDVPNATVMLIEQADRFGLAQLHQ
ncbi:MAG: ATP-dependent DNA helicase RecG, partial [Candidatus Omnitrophica bacterium]|nr:ATP-dependent DNA helicase RecG [Candidatus Omnitrophota bacterium]